MKKLISLLLAAILLTCCAGLAGAEDKVKIVYSSWGSAEEKATEEAIVAAFMAANPNIEVEYIHVDGNYEQKLQIMIAGESAPDVMSIGAAHIPSFAVAFSPVSLENVDASKYIAANLYESLQYEGKQYAFPKRVNTKVFAYNKELLAQAGVAFPGNEYGIDQFIKDAQAVAALGEGIFGSDPLWFGQWVYQFGGRVLEADGTPAINSDAAKKAAQFIIDAVKTYGFAPGHDDTAGIDIMHWFITGKVGFKTDFGPYNLPIMAQIDSFDWDVCAAAGNGGEMEIVGVGVSAKTEHPAEALAFAAYVSNSDEAQAIIGGTSALPVTTAGKAVFLEQYPDKNLNAFFDAMAEQEIPPLIRGNNQIGGIWFDHLYGRTEIGASGGTEDVAVVLDDAAAEIAEMLAEQ